MRQNLVEKKIRASLVRSAATILKHVLKRSKWIDKKAELWLNCSCSLLGCPAWFVERVCTRWARGAIGNWI